MIVATHADPPTFSSCVAYQYKRHLLSEKWLFADKSACARYITCQGKASFDLSALCFKRRAIGCTHR